MGDLLYNFTEWLRSTQLTELALWISDSGLTLWIVSNFWILPVIQVLHILAIAASFASVLMINARMLGIAGSGSMAETANRYIRVLWWSLAALVLTGVLMIIAEPVRELINPIFWIKVGLIIAVIVASLAFHGRVMRRLAGGGVVTGGIRTASVFIIILWCATMLAGRWIAYAPV